MIVTVLIVLAFLTAIPVTINWWLRLIQRRLDERDKR